MFSTIDPDLFVRPDGLPIIFVLEDAHSPKWSVVREQVEEGGGVLLQESESEEGEPGSLIHLASSRMATRSRKSSKEKQVYSIAYVTECIRQNALLPSLEAFTFGLLDEEGDQENLLNMSLGLNPARGVEFEDTSVKIEVSKTSMWKGRSKMNIWKQNL